MDDRLYECEWIELADGRFRCRHCGMFRRLRTRRSCPARISYSPAEYKSLVERYRTFREALKRWDEAGRPVRSADEVELIFRQYCQSCEEYQGSQCRVCGCRVRSGQDVISQAVGAIDERWRAVANKLAMATEHCPLGRW